MVPCDFCYIICRSARSLTWELSSSISLSGEDSAQNHGDPIMIHGYIAAKKTKHLLRYSTLSMLLKGEPWLEDNPRSLGGLNSQK